MNTKIIIVVVADASLNIDAPGYFVLSLLSFIRSSFFSLIYFAFHEYV